jgi:two-component system, NarL family, sensor histidine kinase DesK
VTGLAERTRRPTHRWGAAVRAWWDGSPKRWSRFTPATLFWLVFLPLTPFYDEARPWWAIPLGVVVMVLYAAFYLVVDLRPSRLREHADWISAVLALLVIPANPGGAVLLVYAAGLAGAFRTRRVALRWMLGLTALLVVLLVVSTIPLPWRLFAYGPYLVLVWLVGLMSADGAAEGRAMRIRNAQVEHLATVAERERISRDLHDLLGQTLTGIVVRSQLAQRLVDADPAAGRAEMAAVEHAAREALTEVRATVSGWRQVDIGAELAAARDAMCAAGVELVVERDTDLVLTPSAETALGLALREGATNVVRHAQARRCTITLRGAGDQVELEIADDGTGGGGRDGTGLTGMRERIAALGGEVRRTTHPGTALRITVPRAVAT